MLTGKEVLSILGAIVPMYFPLTIAYVTVRWFNLFTAEQSVGISRFIKTLAIPFLVFNVISSNNLLTINLKLFAADSFQKLISLAALFLWKLLDKNATLEWMITLFCLSSLPNTIIIGLPMATAMYGEESISYMIQTLVFQSAIWVNVLIVLFEYRAAKNIVTAERFKVSVEPEPSPADGECDLNVIFLDQSKEVSDVTIDSNAEIASNGNGNGSFQTKEIGPAADAGENEDHLQTEETSSPSNARATGGMTKLILYMLAKKIIRSPMTYASLLGVLWSIISFKCGIKMPTVIDKCILTLANTGQALSMFSLGIFMATQPNIISCSWSEVASAMVVRFLISPILIAIISKLIGLKGLVLHTAIIQAAFPQGVMAFVFAKEYDVHPNVFSTSVVFGMLISFPILLTYYVIMGVIFK